MKSRSSFRLFARSNSKLSPVVKPAMASIHGDIGGGRCWSLRSMQMVYFGVKTMVARKAVDQKTLRINDLIALFGLQKYKNKH